MREYSKFISLSKNSRGIYSIDPTLGCYSGTKEDKKGCYSDCYASKISKFYGYDFTKTVLRSFENESHLQRIKKQIEKVKLPFIRMGTMGDPSENWEHTLNICELLQQEKQLSLFKKEVKEIVIITKHWTNLTELQLNRLSKLKVCINTSISALDNYTLLNNSLIQFEILKKYCRSVLRIVSCDFNKENEIGLKLSILQDEIFKKYNCLDTVFRVSKNNKLVKDGIINISKTKFLGKNAIVSKYNRKTYFGNCNNCKEMCGVTM
jgi:hypothetical protein